MSYEQKTLPTGASITAFIDTIASSSRQEEARILIKLFQRVTGEDPVLWGKDLVGFRRYRYKYASGHSGESFRVGFSPRKTALSIYVLGVDYDDPSDTVLLSKLGKFTHGVGCMYIKRLEDVDLPTLEKLLHHVLNKKLTGELE